MSGIHLPDLIGVSVSDSRCRLTPTEVARLARLIIAALPPDPQLSAFVGGVVSTVADTLPRGSVQPLADGLDDAPFLVLVSSQYALALLSAPGSERLPTRLLSDADAIDRAALILAQFAASDYVLAPLDNPESQRRTVSRVIARVLADDELQPRVHPDLLPNDQSWLTLGQAINRPRDPAAILQVDVVQQVLRACGSTGAVLGKLHAGEQLQVVASNTGATTTTVSLPPAVLQRLIQRRGALSLTSEDGLHDLGAVLATTARVATLVPLLPSPNDVQPTGILLVTSQRPLPVNARAALVGLAGLLQPLLAAAPAPAAPAQPSADDLLASLLDVPPSPPPPVAAAANAAAPAPDQFDRFADLPLLSFDDLDDLPPDTPADRPAPAPPPAPSTNGARGAGSVLRDLIDHLHDGILLVDGQGRLLSYNAIAAALLDLSPDAVGQAMAASNAVLLVPLFTEALISERVPPQPLTLTSGITVQAGVAPLDDERWSFVLAVPVVPAASAPAAPGYPPAPTSLGNTHFLTSISHTLRDPLQTLRELTARVPAVGALNDLQKQLMGEILKINTDLTLLVNDLLTLGQIRDQVLVEATPLRLDLLIDAAIGTRYAEFGRRAQQVESDLATGDLRVTGSEEGLGRVIGALLDNAINYSPQGAVITVRATPNDDDTITVIVQDTGIGLTAAEAAQVFDPFYRAASAEQLSVPGRGLGLTIARAVIEHHGGQISVESVAGEGSTFRFTLPVSTD